MESSLFFGVWIPSAEKVQIWLGGISGSAWGFSHFLSTAEQSITEFSPLLCWICVFFVSFSKLSQTLALVFSRSLVKRGKTEASGVSVFSVSCLTWKHCVGFFPYSCVVCLYFGTDIQLYQWVFLRFCVDCVLSFSFPPLILYRISKTRVIFQCFQVPNALCNFADMQWKWMINWKSSSFV